MRTEFKIGLAVGLAVLLIFVGYFAIWGGKAEPLAPADEAASDEAATPSMRVEVASDADRPTRPTISLPEGPRLTLDSPSTTERPTIQPSHEPAEEEDTDAEEAPASPTIASPSLPAIRPPVTTTAPPATTARPAIASPTTSTPPSNSLPGSPRISAGPTISSPSPAITSAAKARTYVVKQDDSFWTIAKEMYGDGSKWTYIRDANPNADPNRLRPGQNLTIPPLPASASASPATPSGAIQPAAGQKTYTVKEGEGYWAIAEKVYGHGKYYTELERANKIPSSRLKPGQTIVIPPLSTGGSTVMPSAVPPGGEIAASGGTYTVVQGDQGFWGIAQKVYGNGAHMDVIQQANPDVNPRNLKIGQTLTIPPLPKRDPAASLPRAPRPARESDDRPIFD